MTTTSSPWSLFNSARLMYGRNIEHLIVAQMAMEREVHSLWPYLYMARLAALHVKRF